MKRRPVPVTFAALFVVALLFSFLSRPGPATAQIAPSLIDRAGGAYNGVEVTLEAGAAPLPAASSRSP